MFLIDNMIYQPVVCCRTGLWRSWVWIPPAARYKAKPHASRTPQPLSHDETSTLSARTSSADDLALQVTDKDADGVLDEIESAIFQAAASILAGQGFSYRYPDERAIGMNDINCDVVGIGSAVQALLCLSMVHVMQFVEQAI